MGNIESVGTVIKVVDTDLDLAFESVGTVVKAASTEPPPVKSSDDVAAQPSWRNCVLVDSLAANMPPIAPEAFEELIADVAEHGIRNEITLFKDSDGNESVLDGCNRLDAAERAGLLVVKDGALNPDVVPIRYVHGNTDRAKYVRAQNFLRRHLSAEQKRAEIRKRLVENPERSDRDIGREIGVDHKTVASERRELESSGEIPHTEVRKGKDGRARPAPKPKQGAVDPSVERPNQPAAPADDHDHRPGDHDGDHDQRPDDGRTAGGPETSDEPSGQAGEDDHAGGGDHAGDGDDNCPEPRPPTIAELTAKFVNDLTATELQSFLDQLSPNTRAALGVDDSHLSSAPKLSAKAWHAAKSEADEAVKTEIMRGEELEIILKRMSDLQRDKLFDRLVALQIRQAKSASKSADDMLKSITGTFWYAAGQDDPQKIAEAMAVINGKLAMRQLSAKDIKLAVAKRERAIPPVAKTPKRRK